MHQLPCRALATLHVQHTTMCLRSTPLPYRWFTTRSGVTALDFSRHQPNILAVGQYDGTVAVYDVKARQVWLRSYFGQSSGEARFESGLVRAIVS